MNETAKLANELTSQTCRCGKVKQKRQTFCKTCYFRIPHTLRDKLYKPMGGGYEEAHAEACNFLDSIGRKAQ